MAKILILDIETSPCISYCWGIYKETMSIDQIIKPSEMISFAAKWYGAQSIGFYSQFHDGKKAMLDRLHELLDEADFVVHFNGRAFDIPTINKDFIMNNYLPPSPYRQVDLMETAKRTFRWQSNKLDFLCQQLGLGKKVEHEGFPLWKKCLAGDEKAWGRMKTYNIHDVVLTEKLYEKMKPWIHNHPNVATIDGRPKACPVCGKEGTLQSRGTRILQKNVYKQYWCAKTKSKDGCGSWPTGERIK